MALDLPNSEIEDDICQINNLLIAVDLVLRCALDRVDVHPCDERDDTVKAKGLQEDMLHLYKIRHKYFK